MSSDFQTLKTKFRQAAGWVRNKTEQAPHHIYWESYGNPEGRPYFVLHGNAGYLVDPKKLSVFDPEKHNVIFIHQRGVGRSEPLGKSEDNLYPDLIEDIEQVRKAMGVHKINFLAWSAGAAQALLYAENHPDHVESITSYAPFLGTDDDLKAYFGLFSQAYPENWQRLISFHDARDIDDFIEKHAEGCTSNDEQKRLMSTVLYHYLSTPGLTVNEMIESKTSEEWVRINKAMAIHAMQMKERYGLTDHQIEANRHNIQKDCPITFVYGQKDNIVQYDSDRAQKWLELNAAFAEVSGEGHDIHTNRVQKALKQIIMVTDKKYSSGVSYKI